MTPFIQISITELKDRLSKNQKYMILSEPTDLIGQGSEIITWLGPHDKIPDKSIGHSIVIIKVIK